MGSFQSPHGRDDRYKISSKLWTALVVSGQIPFPSCAHLHLQFCWLNQKFHGLRVLNVNLWVAKLSCLLAKSCQIPIVSGEISHIPMNIKKNHAKSKVFLVKKIQVLPEIMYTPMGSGCSPNSRQIPCLAPCWRLFPMLQPSKSHGNQAFFPIFVRVNPTSEARRCPFKALRCKALWPWKSCRNRMGLLFKPFLTFWCLVGNGWQWGLLGLLWIVIVDHSLIPD